MRNKESSTIAKAFIDHFILKFGSVEKVKSDFGSEYVNSLFKSINEILKINHAHSTPYRPQTIGSLERNHRNFNEFLRIYINETLSDWDEWIPYYEFCYNTTPCVSTGYTPYELVFGKKVNLPIDLRKEDIDPVYNLDDYSKEFKFKMQVTHNRAKDLLLRKKMLRKELHDSQITRQKCLSIGDKVMLRSFGQNKLEPVKQGPFIIIDMSESNAIIQEADPSNGNRKPNGKMKTVHKNHLSTY